MKKYKSSFLNSILQLVLLMGFSLLLNLQVLAQGSLNVSPQRAIFEGQKRILELNVSNDSQDSAKYTISFVQIRMTELGVMQWITDPDPGQRFADKYIRVFPRMIRLGPNQTQVVRLQLAKTDQLEQGEYRSHLYFKSMVPQKGLSAEDVNKNTGVLLSIEATFGFTMPVIIRVGEPTTMVNITNMKIETGADGSKKLNLTLNRTGNMSTYGEISVKYIALSGKETEIGLLGNVAVYTPNSLLKQQIPLDKIQNVDFTKGKIKAVYSTKSGTRTEKLAEAEISL